MLPPKLQSVIDACGIGETVPQWQISVTHSIVTATLIWTIPSAPVAPVSHPSCNQVVGSHTSPTLDRPPPRRKHKSPSSRRRDLRRRERWRTQAGSIHRSPESPSPVSPCASLDLHHEGQASPANHDNRCLHTSLDIPSSNSTPDHTPHLNTAYQKCAPVFSDTSMDISSSITDFPTNLHPLKNVTSTGLDTPSCTSTVSSSTVPNYDLPLATSNNQDARLDAPSSTTSVYHQPLSVHSDKTTVDSDSSDSQSLGPDNGDNSDFPDSGHSSAAHHSNQYVASEDPHENNNSIESDGEYSDSDSSDHSDVDKCSKSFQISKDEPRRLSHHETQESLDQWKCDMERWLATDSDFEPFLSGLVWTRTMWAPPFRGLSDDSPSGKSAQQKLWALSAMLSLITKFCPVIAPRAICDRTTSMDNVMQLIYIHFNCKL